MGQFQPQLQLCDPVGGHQLPTGGGKGTVSGEADPGGGKSGRIVKGQDHRRGITAGDSVAGGACISERGRGQVEGNLPAFLDGQCGVCPVVLYGHVGDRVVPLGAGSQIGHVALGDPTSRPQDVGGGGAPRHIIDGSGRKIEIIRRCVLLAPIYGAVNIRIGRLYRHHVAADRLHVFVSRRIYRHRDVFLRHFDGSADPGLRPAPALGGKADRSQIRPFGRFRDGVGTRVPISAVLLFRSGGKGHGLAVDRCSNCSTCRRQRPQLHLFPGGGADVPFRGHILQQGGHPGPCRRCRKRCNDHHKHK